MSPINQPMVLRKINSMIQLLNYLDILNSEGLAKYLGDFRSRKSCERILQELIETASDLNGHLLVEKGHASPEDYYDGFMKMGQFGLIPVELAQQLAPCAGLRNRIVHEYDVLDQQIVFESIAIAQGLFPKYIAAIQCIEN